jgi:hypothetical protein
MTVGRRHSGSLRQLPSGRYQVRYTGPDGRRRTAPQTFPSRTLARRWLSLNCRTLFLRADPTVTRKIQYRLTAAEIDNKGERVAYRAELRLSDGSATILGFSLINFTLWFGARFGLRSRIPPVSLQAFPWRNVLAVKVSIFALIETERSPIISPSYPRSRFEPEVRWNSSNDGNGSRIGVYDREHFVEQATAVGASLPMLTALGDVARDEDLWTLANRDTGAFFAERGLELPDGLRVKPIAWPGFGKPSPEWEPFTIRVTLCQRVWIRGEDGRLREEEFCRGFEVVQSPIPGGPVG